MEEKILQAIMNLEKNLMKEINGLKESINKLEQRIDKLEQRMDKLEERQDKMEKELLELPGIISKSVEEYFCRMDYRIQKLNDADESKQVELVNVNKRLSRLEIKNGILEPIC